MRWPDRGTPRVGRSCTRSDCYRSSSLPRATAWLRGDAWRCTRFAARVIRVAAGCKLLLAPPSRRNGSLSRSRLQGKSHAPGRYDVHPHFTTTSSARRRRTGVCIRYGGDRIKLYHRPREYCGSSTVPNSDVLFPLPDREATAAREHRPRPVRLHARARTRLARGGTRCGPPRINPFGTDHAGLCLIRTSLLAVPVIYCLERHRADWHRVSCQC
jgi:hypothetical protein